MPAPSQSLPRAQIIRRRVVFDTARARGQRVSNRYMTLNFIACEAVPPGETGTVAFLTPKRVGGATERTQLRRRMREIYRRRIARTEETMYLIWIARPAALELDFEEMAKCMAELKARRDRFVVD